MIVHVYILYSCVLSKICAYVKELSLFFNMLICFYIYMCCALLHIFVKFLYLHTCLYPHSC